MLRKSALAVFIAVVCIFFAFSTGSKLYAADDSPRMADAVRAQVLSEENAKLAKQIETSPGSCSFSSPGNCLGQAAEWLIKSLLLNIAGFFLWIAANIFNYSINLGILNFSSWAPDSLYPVWMVVRQILSLCIVFVGLYLGFLYILGKEDRFEKYIPWVIMFGLFVNFSYPLTRTVIDISNVVALKTYVAAVGDNPFTSNLGAGGKILNSLGLNGLITSATPAESAQNADTMYKSIKGVPGSLLAVLFVFYAAYIFLVASGIMITRTATLIFITIASPFLLIDSLLPFLGDHAKKLRGTFFEQLIVAPVFMVMYAITTKFLEAFPKDLTSISQGLDTGSSTIPTFFNLLMMMIMLHIMLKVTKEVSGTVGQFATNAFGKVGGFAGGLALGAATGGAGLLARGTVGRIASNATKLGSGLDRWKDQSGVSGAIGRRVFNFTDSIAKSSFDARNTSFVKGNASKLGLSSGMGAGVTKGFRELQEDTAMRRLQTRDNIIKRAMKIDKKSRADALLLGDEYVQREMTAPVGSRFLGQFGKEKIADHINEQSEAKKKLIEREYTRYNGRATDAEKQKLLADIEDPEIRKGVLEKVAEEGRKKVAAQTESEAMQTTNSKTTQAPPQDNKQPSTSQDSTTTQTKIENTDWSAYEAPAINRTQNNTATEQKVSPNTATTEPKTVTWDPYTPPVASKKGGKDPDDDNLGAAGAPVTNPPTPKSPPTGEAVNGNVTRNFGERRRAAREREAKQHEPEAA